MIINIRNFRGIKELSLEISRGITIFIGPNDSGKSSAIEAIYLGLTAFNNFKGSFIEYSSLAYLITRRNTKISSLIFNNERLAEIELKLNNEKFLIQISNELNALNVEEKVKDELKKIAEEAILKSQDTVKGYNALVKLFFNLMQASLAMETERSLLLGKTHSLGLEVPLTVNRIYGIFKDSNSILSSFVIFTVERFPMLRIEVKKSPQIKMGALFMDFANRRPIEEINRFISEVVKRGLKEEILKYLKLGNTQIISIDLAIEDGKVVPLIQYSWTGGGIPLELSGDGLKTLLAIALASRVLENHYILLEEPENHLHPKLIDVVSKLIVDMSKKGVNYVIATHSIEFIKSIMKEASKTNISVTIYYLKRLDDGKIKVVKYDKKSAELKILKLEMDLRN